MTVVCPIIIPGMLTWHASNSTLRGPCGPGHLTVMLQCALQSQSDEEIARAQIGLQGSN